MEAIAMLEQDIRYEHVWILFLGRQEAVDGVLESKWIEGTMRHRRVLLLFGRGQKHGMDAVRLH